jgi:hypothetical protein
MKFTAKKYSEEMMKQIKPIIFALFGMSTKTMSGR